MTTSLTPSLLAAVTDPNGQALRAEFEVEHDPAAPAGQGSGQIWTGGVENVPSGNQASVAVAPGELTDGWKVRWRARAVNVATTVGSPWSQWHSLTVDLPDPVSEPAVGTLQVTPSQMVDGTIVTDTLTPALVAQVSDPVGGSLRAEFEVEHDPAAPAEQGTGQIWAGAADGVASGAVASVTVPEGKLGDGWKLRWRARALSAIATSAWSDWHSFTSDAPDPTVTNSSITPSALIDGTATTTLTPTLRAVVTHPGGHPLRAEFEIEHDPSAPQGQGSGQIWTGSVDDVASGTVGEIVVPAGELTDGWKVRWRTRAAAIGQASAWSTWQTVTAKTTLTGIGPFAQTAAAVVPDGSDFSVAAWLRLSDKDGAYTIMEQRGTSQAPFRLGNDPEHGLVFTFTNADAPGATVEGVRSAVEPPVDEWFHLAATYTNDSRNASLYLNGKSIGSAVLGFTPWNASGNMTLGTAMAGTLDEVWVYGRELLSDEVFALMDGSSATPVGFGAGPSARAAAPSFTYDRIKPEDCKKDYGAGKRTYGLMKNRFSGCFRSSAVVFQPDDDDQPQNDYDAKAAWSADFLFVAKTFSGRRGLDSGATTRDVWYDVYLSSESAFADPYDRLDEVELTVGMAPASGQTACKNVTSGGQKNHVSKRVRDWDALYDPYDPKLAHVATFRFRADPGDAPATRKNRAKETVANAEKISECIFGQYAKITYQEDGERVRWTYGATDQNAVVRCDSADSKITRTTGGCILPVTPSIQWRMGAQYDEAYIHYWKACYDKADTFPKNPNKKIPGCAVNGTGRPSKDLYLWRVGEPRQDNSRGRSGTRCHSLWPNYGINSQDCDEYPFASAGNRTVDGDQDGDLSVCAMPKPPNSTAGNLLRRLFNNDRILLEDVFFNRFSGEPDPLPSMENNCWPGHINKASRYYTGH
ncbi:LamG-like jellyroll fold domain-containing protein [Sinosporangium siamense]|uniref:LamG-like jellyroll fold domain-containing protein n=1 Tax=Sinosporangium siamense TaxID=1367973 RepID=A0A919VBN0_9ACTN|nr:LamG-like jellyroll fold domain-containing protein [Sinosporangium siamense]GII97548.1 hypothetical protein Ssi02_77790 [Sinosporangium siamense]